MGQEKQNKEEKMNNFLSGNKQENKEEKDQKPKYSCGSKLGVVLAIVLTAVLVGGGVYYLMNQQFKSEKSELIAQVENERQMKEGCEMKKEEDEKNKNCELEIKGKDLTIEKLKSVFSENIDILDTTTWKTKDTSREIELKFKFKYPSNWITDEMGGGISVIFPFFDSTSYKKICKKNESEKIICYDDAKRVAHMEILSPEYEGYSPDYEQSTTKDIILDGHQAIIIQGKVKQDSRGLAATDPGEVESLLVVKNEQQKAIFKFGMTTSTEEEKKIFDLLINTIDFQ